MSTVSSEGQTNIAPMGPMVEPGFDRFEFRPFQSSTTYRNIKATGVGVFHVTDDALLIARGAIGTINPADIPVKPAAHVAGVVLTEACRYYELQVETLDDSQERTHIVMRTVDRQTLRDFFGFHRARHAVIEAAILATRLHLTGKSHVLATYKSLQIMVDKTGSDPEHQAMQELRDYVERYDYDEHAS